MFLILALEIVQLLAHFMKHHERLHNFRGLVLVLSELGPPVPGLPDADIDALPHVPRGGA
jgi:hypothetical protein